MRNAVPRGDGMSSLCSWCDQATKLELEILVLSRQTQEGERLLQVAHAEASEARARKEHAAAGLVEAKRAKKILDSQLMAAEGSFQEQLAVRDCHERDNAGLNRSLQGLQRKIQKMSLQAGRCHELAGAEADREDAAHIEEESLRQSISSMAHVQSTLEGRVASEHQKRLRLKAAVRLKLDRIGVAQNTLKQSIHDYEEEIKGWKDKLSAQEAQTAARFGELAHLKKAAAAAQENANKQQEAAIGFRNFLEEMLEAHGRLRSELEATQKELNELNEKESKARYQWRMDHVNNIDRRINVQRMMDQDIIIAEVEVPRQVPQPTNISVSVQAEGTS